MKPQDLTPEQLRDAARRLRMFAEQNENSFPLAREAFACSCALLDSKDDEPGTRLSSTRLQTSEPERPAAPQGAVEALRQPSSIADIAPESSLDDADTLPPPPPAPAKRPRKGKHD